MDIHWRRRRIAFLFRAESRNGKHFPCTHKKITKRTPTPPQHCNDVADILDA